MQRGWVFGAIFRVLALLGPSYQMDVTIENTNSGFFLKPLFHGQEVFILNTEEKHLAVSQLGHAASVRASFGAYSDSEEVSRSLLQGNISQALSSLVVGGQEVSAHLVTRTVTQERPLLQVLYHASQIPKGGNTIRNAKIENPKRDDDTRWCMQMHVEKDGQELTSVCVLGGVDNVCIAELTLPSSWWDPVITQSAQVFFSLYGIDQNLQCSSATSTIEEHAANSSERVKNYVSSITLTHGQMAYQELKEDQHILIYVPQKSFYPGSKFRVPVKLQAESDLQIFVIKLKTRHGISVVGAEAADATKWRISVDLNHKQQGAMVTAFVADRENYRKTDRIQDIFEWIFEVEDDAIEEDRGRITMVLEYEMNQQFKEKYGSVENKVVARVQIQRDNTYSIVPVIKNTEIINTAILTGKIQNFSMRVYSVSQAGKIGDITSQTTCHSGDEEVLKVSQSCNLVYLDGSESRGSPSVSVIAKYGRHTKFLFFRVWTPEMPLEIEMSDSKLSQIKGWKAPKHLRRKTRGVDFGILTHPGLKLPMQEEEIRKEDYATTCHLRFQQSLVEVYARFLIPEGTKHLFLIHRKALYRITDLVIDRLRIADTSIAILNGNVVEGLRPGRTEIQVLSRMGRVIGAREVKVGNDKVNIARLEVDVVTGLDIELSPAPEMPGTVIAKIIKSSQMTRKYQEGVLDVSVKFDDGTSMPLQYIPSSDYFLDMDTLNNHVVAFGPMVSSDIPRVIALGQGKGELLKLAMELGDLCQRKKTRPLAVSYVYIDVDFAEDPSKEEDLQNDASHYGYGNKANERFGDRDAKGGYVDKDGKRKSGGALGPTDEDTPQEEYDSDVGVMSHDESQPNHEAQQQHIMKAQGMTPLEIGMYILLGVFCLAIIVFMLNCMIFVVRYRRKRQPKDSRHGPVAQVDDWVWIGRETLERNAINTTCQQALMPEADFNGNHNPTQQLAAPENQPNSNRGSACSSGGQGSNRNSMVSTYKGSECSIRITANPLIGGEDADSEDVITEEDSGSTSGQSMAAGPSTLLDPPPIRPPSHTPLHHHHSVPRSTHKLGRSSLGQRPKSLPRNLTPRPDSAILARQEALKQEFLRQQSEGATSGSEFEFDYEAMGLTYDQLMVYFDNLKESTA